MRVGSIAAVRVDVRNLGAGLAAVALVVASLAAATWSGDRVDGPHVVDVAGLHVESPGDGAVLTPAGGGVERAAARLGNVRYLLAGVLVALGVALAGRLGRAPDDDRRQVVGTRVLGCDPARAPPALLVP